MTTDKHTKPRSTLARAARALALVLAGAALVVASVAAVLLFSKTHGDDPLKVLARADAALPGRALDRKGVVAVARIAGIHGDLVGGRCRFARCRRPSLRVGGLDVPFRKGHPRRERDRGGRFGGRSGDPGEIRETGEKVQAKTEKGDGGFPRDGSVPGIPSIYAERIRIRETSVRVSEAGELNDIGADLAFDLTSGAPPWGSDRYPGGRDRRGAGESTACRSTLRPTGA